MDPLDHPDMHQLGVRLGAQLEDILAAEQYAARIAAQRRTTMRDRLVRAEDMGVDITVTTAHGVYEGSVAAVGTDHIVVNGSRRSVVALHHVVAIEMAG
jgi:phosphoglycerate-specific signal transduction histidine kinase